MAIDWVAFRQAMEKHNSFLLVSHIRPDCDALGSELGMAEVLRCFGKKVQIVNGHVTPPNLAFIDPDNQIKGINAQISAEQIEPFDAILILDTSAWAQLGDMGAIIKASSAAKYVLDHHVGEDDLGATLFKNTTAEAAGRLVIEAADALGVTLNAKMATPLFAAIATDTGWFRFGSARAETYRFAARLIEAGAKPAEIYGALYEQDTLGRQKLRGVVLSRIEAELEGKLATTFIAKEDFANTGALPSDTEDLVNLLLAIKGTLVAIIFVEQTTGGFKLSFRSRCALDCSKLAAKFAGGGHKAAAGAFLTGPLEEVKAKVMPEVYAAMKELG